MKICLLGVLFKRICLIAHICVKPAKTAVTEWLAANVGHTQVNLSASVKRGITAKVCSMNAQLAHQGHTNPKVFQEESPLAFRVRMKITPLHLEVHPRKIVSARRAIGPLARPVKLSTALP
ncbi:sushi, von Willebrand factor type A, EGF and pentraxin domain containing 1 [Rhinolophus ferrumequinum]|uniref:Sushi, von Willebrand factor type A, EGF and pentraxin domain containing 1 n=1 Tax=Rhinolophus ferrumequinum TaxID=59479 RepID=A0A7J7VT89_RHIFE|nr:sushi, von Willebrand factor type A, EGF and pentraxin domain containing 1 [Rhinolophus ferrumequinum]